MSQVPHLYTTRSSAPEVRGDYRDKRNVADDGSLATGRTLRDPFGTRPHEAVCCKNAPRTRLEPPADDCRASCAPAREAIASEVEGAGPK
jgi:hypothetical protein